MSNKLLIIMCTWNRIESRLNRTLDMLKNQDNQDFDFYIWNNNAEKIDKLESICKNHSFKNINIYHSSNNIGGIARFKLAQKLSDTYENVLFIDDDIDFDVDTISIVKQNIEKNSIKSWWSWNIHNNNYWDRTRILKTGKQADYCGTGMMLCNTKLFNNEKIYQLIPEKYLFIEDLWLSYFSNAFLNLKCEFLPVKAKLVEDGKNQSEIYARTNMKSKKDFYLFLKENY